MIYRIAVYRDGKFDHYATPEEMNLLRVNAAGEVEALDAAIYCSDFVDQSGTPFEISEWAAEDEYYHGNIKGQWSDVSETHKVEWGCILPHIGRVYVNDIIGYADRDSSYNEHVGTLAIDIMYWGYNKGQYATGKVIGDIHENPELMGGDL